MLKKILITFLSMSLILSLSSCTNSSSNTATTSAKDTTFKIGAIQFIQHDALDKAYLGFKDYLDENNIKYTMDFQNASGEQSACQTIAEKFVNEGLDLIYAIATPAAQAVQAVDTDIPVVISAVTDPAGAKLCETNEKPNGIITGASDLTPVDAQISLLKELLPESKNVAVFYCATEANSKIQADMAIESCKKRGLNPTVYTISNSNEIQTIMESMIGKEDVIYIPTDNTLAAGMETVGTIALDNKIPVICGEIGMTQTGGYATYSIDYYQLGKLAGEMAKRILIDNEDPASMPVSYLDGNKCERYINKDFANALGLKAE